MSIELAALGLAKTVARRAAATWLGTRKAEAERALDLSELIRARVPGLLPARDAERLFDGTADAVMRRVQPMLNAEFSGLDDAERLAAVQAVVDTLSAADIDDATLFASNVEPEALAAEVRRRIPGVAQRAALSDSASRLYDLLLDECCEDYVRILITLPPFVARAQVEELGRLSRLEPLIADLLARLPARSLYAPAGAGHDEEFRREYLTLVLAELDEFELYGADPNRHAQPKLSLGYVPLGLAADVARTTGEARPDTSRALRNGLEHTPQLARTLDTEAVLARSPRTFIRADAGSGKTTLLRWLAVTAARGGFTGALSAWNGLVPFFVRLRGLPKGPLPAPSALIHPIGTAISGYMPQAWVERQFRAGRALLLVDGVDELARERRPAVRDWLIGIVTAYPTVPIVVTSRPMAAGRGWLEKAGFSGSVIPPMRAEQLRQFVARWHETVREAAAKVSTPDQAARAGEELARRERALRQRLDAAPHLRSLAANPLLAALLCAINLERGSNLPRNRLELYQAALEMLLHRRDTERGIEAEVDLEYGEKLDLHADLAYRLTLYGHTELRADDARRFVAERVAAMPRVSTDPNKVFDHLLTRCGVLREPVVGRLDFVHRTFQEYLAARSLIAQSHLQLLIDRAHRDTWRETFIMAVGLAGERDRVRLLGALLDRSDIEKRRARKLRLLAVACLETATIVPDEALRDRMDACIRTLMPPRDRDEARVFAASGTAALSYLPEKTEPLSETQAEACIRTAALIGGEPAMRVLAGYNQDNRYAVQSSLLASWKYFEPAEYARAVLADAALETTWVFVSAEYSWRIPFVAHLARLRWLRTNRFDTLDSQKMGKLKSLVAAGVTQTTLEVVARLDALKHVSLRGNEALIDLSPLRRLRNAQDVQLHFEEVPNIEDWRLPEGLISLGAGQFSGDVNAAALHRYPNLEVIDLSGSGMVRRIDALAKLPLTWVSFAGLCPEGGLETLVAATPRLRSLGLVDCPWVSNLACLVAISDLHWLRLETCINADLSSIPYLPGITTTYFNRTPVARLSWLARLPALQRLSLAGNPATFDLDELPDLPHLDQLSLVGAYPGLDLSALAGRRHLQVMLYEGQLVYGAERLGRGVTVARIAPPEGYDPSAPVEL